MLFFYVHAKFLNYYLHDNYSKTVAKVGFLIES